MTKRALLNLSLLGIIAVLVAIALWQPGIDRPAAKPPLTTILATDIKHITITRPRTSDIELQRSNGDWTLLQPQRGRTNPFVVNEILRILNAKNHLSLPPEAVKQLGRYGLDHPKARLQLDQLEILFGDTSPVSKLQYVLLQNRVAMIDNAYYWSTVRTHSNFFSKRLIEKNRNPIALSLPNTRLSLEDGTWQTYPKQKDLSADSIKNLIDQWRYAQALSVKKYRDTRVMEWVRLSFKDEKTRLRIGILSRSPELVLYRPDEKLQYHFPEEVGKRLFSFSE